MRLSIGPLIFLVGCASPAQTEWHHSSFSSVTAERQQIIDSAECRAYAATNVPMPERASTQLPRSPKTYDFEGSAEVSNAGSLRPSYTQTYQGTVRERSNTFDVGYAIGADFGEGIRHSAKRRAAMNLQSDLTDACMMRRGWIKAEGQASLDRQKLNDSAHQTAVDEVWPAEESRLHSNLATSPSTTTLDDIYRSLSPAEKELINQFAPADRAEYLQRFRDQHE